MLSFRFGSGVLSFRFVLGMLSFRFVLGVLRLMFVLGVLSLGFGRRFYSATIERMMNIKEQKKKKKTALEIGLGVRLGG